MRCFDGPHKSRQYSVTIGKHDEPGRDEGTRSGSEEHDKEQRTALQADDQVVYNRLFRNFFASNVLVIFFKRKYSITSNQAMLICNYNFDDDGNSVEAIGVE